jgi:cysteine desulfurase
VALFVDGIAGAGKRPLDMSALGIDALAIASHKLGGPAGAGALIVRHGLVLEPQLLGGGQERGLRAGSPDVLALVGFGAACAALAERLAAQPRIEQLRDRAERRLRELGLVINGEQAPGVGPRVATVVNASVPGAAGPELVAALDLEGVCVSHGAACSSGLAEPSPVLRAMYPDEPERARGALRLSFGPETQETDVDFALAALATVLARRRAAST